MLNNNNNNNNMINKKVVIKDDVENMSGMKGVIVGVGEDDCVYGDMFEVRFEDGSSEFMMECDFDVIK